MEVRDFVELAESGAYIAGDRRVSRTERTKWRVTFRRLATEAQSALHATDSGPAEEAKELMIDLVSPRRRCGTPSRTPASPNWSASRARMRRWR